ncbi:sensor histidine kinase [Paenibacillus gallinarum]|uniref:histidine kinase n=1 Tax=Paenibacillus gallinarum TaxID=2762232 RepID=A0ABR8T2M4_9BACL|nr:HAMP domain-containing sensor histidine kinase [Paenibacillus gallinarum]MBD7969999.1 HAMP domain-containing histidine kinase [Paenibacillus gallinarum]
MKLRTTIYVYTSVLFIVLLLLINGFIYFMFDRMSTDTQMKRAEAEANSISTGVRNAADIVAPDDLLRSFVPAEGMLRMVRMTGDNPPAVTSLSEQRLAQTTPTFYPNKHTEVLKIDNVRYVFVSMPVIWADGEVVNLQVTESLASVDNNLKVLQVVLISVSLVALLAVLVSSRLLGSIIIRPISSMTQTMKIIEDGGGFKTLDLQNQSKDELYEMGETFNRMMGRLERNYEKQEQFVSNASHELKTPLTVIESYASLLKRRGMSRPDLFEESVEAIHSEAIRMREMTEQLLMMARQTESGSINLEKHDLTSMVTDMARSYGTAYQREIKVETASSEPCIASTDINKAKQLLVILLDNARKYSEDSILIRVQPDASYITISVTDYGPGIPADELPKVFDRFYRVDQARSRKQGGTGLGLSLASEIAAQIKAEIRLESTYGKGTTAYIQFPTSHLA